MQAQQLIVTTDLHTFMFIFATEKSMSKVTFGPFTTYTAQFH